VYRACLGDGFKYKHLSVESGQQRAALFITISLQCTAHIFRRVRKIAKMVMSFKIQIMSVRPHGTSRLSLGGFSKKKMSYLTAFRKHVEKIQVSLEPDKDNE
jgi:hypothetical protein